MSVSTLLIADLQLARTPTPLATFLTIYFKARHECQIMYMDKAEILHSWLTSNGHVPLAIPIVPEDYRLPPLLAASYELAQLAKVIIGSVHSNPNFDAWLTDLAKMQYSIYTTISNDSNIRKLL